MAKNAAAEKEKGLEEGAIDTLKPGAMPGGPDPKSKLDILSSVIGALAEVDKGSLPNLFDKVQSTVVAAGRAGLDTSEKNKASISAKPSDASPAPTWSDMAGIVKSYSKEEISAAFAGSELSEEFKEKATLIFETALEARVKLEVQRIEEENEKVLTEFEEELEKEIVEKIDVHMNHVVDAWLEENAVAIESTLRSDLTAEFIDGLKKLFTEHYINVPEEQADVVEGLSLKVDELSAQVEKLMGENQKLKEQVGDRTREEVVEEMTKGLATTQVEKIKTLAEGVEYKDRDDLSKKMKVIIENYFPTGKKAPQPLNEGTEGTDPEKPSGAKPSSMDVYADAITRSIRR